MIITEITIKQLPRGLAAYRRYIEDYDCGIVVGPEGSISLIFYKNKLPYVLVVGSWTKSPVIYCNREELSLNDEANMDKLSPKNLIKDMKTFLDEMHKCDRQTPQIDPVRTYKDVIEREG